MCLFGDGHDCIRGPAKGREIADSEKLSQAIALLDGGDTAGGERVLRDVCSRAPQQYEYCSVDARLWLRSTGRAILTGNLPAGDTCLAAFAFAEKPDCSLPSPGSRTPWASEEYSRPWNRWRGLGAHEA